MSKVGAGPRIYDTLQYQHARVVPLQRSRGVRGRSLADTRDDDRTIGSRRASNGASHRTGSPLVSSSLTGPSTRGGQLEPIAPITAWCEPRLCSWPQTGCP